MKTSARSTAFASAALFSAAAAWALHQQTGYLFASLVCGPGRGLIWVVTALVVVLMGAGAWLSWRIVAPARRDASEPSSRAAPRRFLAMVGLMAGGVFLFAITLQACAALILPPCAA
jgi:hypothetical protein